MSSDTKIPVRWSSQLSVLPVTQPVPLRGDKIILPPSTLEQLLSASTVTLPSTNQPQTSTFDAYNPYSYAAEQQARAQLFERQQELPHPLTFRLVNPLNGRVCYAGVREFSADEGFVGLSPFLSHSLGFDESQDKEPPRALPNGNDTHRPPYPSESKLTVHFETLPKGTYVRLRPLEAGYDPEDWKALLEKHLRDNFTTLTNGEIMTVASGREEYRFLVDGLRPNEKAIILVDTDLEVDIEPLNEEQARETLKRRALKAQRAPGTADGSSPGGLVSLGQIVAGQVRSGDYVDYTIEEWDRRIDLELELSPANDEQDIDLLVTPAGPKQCARPREDEHVFADFSPSPSKRIKIKHTNAELDNSDALWISVRGYSHENSSTQKTAPIPYSLCITSTASSTAPSVDGPDTPIPTATAPSLDEDICSNCHQSVPRRTMFLHQNFCLRNNISCPHCHNVFQKSSPEWKNHWHCSHDSSHGISPSSQQKHNRLYHTSQTCPSCAHPCNNMLELAHHRTTTCPAKPILCQFCHLLVPQRGPDDPELTDPEVLLSGLTPHELIDGARTTECHLCSKIIRLRDMSTHLKHHAYERLSRTKPVICRNSCCGRTLVGYFNSDGKRTSRDGGGRDNSMGICNPCFGPLYANTYDPEGKQLRRRVERRYLSQMMTGCGKGWCRNAVCKTGRANLGVESIKGSKEIGVLVKGLLEGGGVGFCTDEGSQRRRGLAEMVAAERGVGDGFVGGEIRDKGKGQKKDDDEGEGGGYDIEWCVNALEVEGGNLLKARGWLKDWAVTRKEEAAR